MSLWTPILDPRARWLGPQGVRLATIGYYARREWLIDLQARIGRTESGCEFLKRTGAYGKERPR